MGISANTVDKHIREATRRLDGSYQAEVGATEASGSYNVEVIAKGASTKSKTIFSRTGRWTVLSEAAET